VGGDRIQRLGSESLPIWTPTLDGGRCRYFMIIFGSMPDVDQVDLTAHRPSDPGEVTAALGSERCQAAA
jgi:hypothetical protein